MDGITTTFDPDDLSPQPRPPVQPTRPPREKSKRPQLSCNPCRARKVKVSRHWSENFLFRISLTQVMPV